MLEVGVLPRTLVFGTSIRVSWKNTNESDTAAQMDKSDEGCGTTGASANPKDLCGCPVQSAKQPRTRAKKAIGGDSETLNAVSATAGVVQENSDSDPPSRQRWSGGSLVGRSARNSGCAVAESDPLAPFSGRRPAVPAVQRERNFHTTLYFR